MDLNSLGIFSYLRIRFFSFKLRKKPEKENVSVKKCIFPFFGCQNLGVYTSMSLWKSHSLQMGTKSYLEKQSQLKSRLPPEMTLLKSQQNFQSRVKSNFLFTPISDIYFKKFSRWLDVRQSYQMGVLIPKCHFRLY